ncbi:MAG: cation transporter [Proteobacteria bacterium]|nr:cation transporter [Pseudomonadota bacterium]MBS0463009.1 cation transporter [Pseudomonadota bacterium]MBS0464305.1 cation transporter [Pseudomonadota bacterium]
MSGKADSLKTIFYALGANFVIFLSKLAAAVFTGSGALLAEAIHSLADCGNQILLLWGVRQAKRPPSPDYPLGHGREVYFWSFMVALLLFSVGGIFSVSEGWHKLHDPQPLSMPWLAVGVLVFGIVAESMSMRACLQEVAKARDGRSLYRWFRESRQAELVVIFGEDLAALFGLGFALGAVVLTMLTGNPLYDAIGTLAIGVLLIAVALFVAIEVKGLLVGQGVDPAVHRAIYAWLNDRAEIRGVLSLITLQMGEQVMVSVQAQMDFSVRGDELVRQINAVERALKQQFPAVRWMFFEPDETD